VLYRWRSSDGNGHVGAEDCAQANINDMAPVATADLVNESRADKEFDAATVLPQAEGRLKDLWFEHGHPWTFE
jgi:hypothetical protein